MRKHATRRTAFDITVRTVLGITVALGVGSSSLAEEKNKKWLLQFEPMYVQTYGHDQHVLTVNEIQTGPPAVGTKTAVNLETDAGFAYRFELRRSGKPLGWGIDHFRLGTSQKITDLTAAADGPSGPINEVVFQIADREFTSTDPGEVLFYSGLGDTDLEVWTLDLYGTRALANKPNSGIHLQFGLRFGDLDNDYFVVVGERDVSGTFVGASSNYDRMMGPLVGLGGHVQIGRSLINGYIGQSVLIGSVLLSNTYEDFTGPVSMPTFVSREVFRKDQDVGIPVTEFRIKWTYRLSKLVALGAGANASAWWDVSVPPGIVPGEGGDEVLHENTIVFLGLVAAVEFTF